MAATNIVILACSLVFALLAHNLVQAHKSEGVPKMSQSHEKRLVDRLLRDYGDTSVRPLMDSDVVQVEFKMSLISVLDLDVKRHVLSTRVWLHEFWTDEFLQWNPDEFGGITKIRVRTSSMWRPDIVLYNSADDTYLKDLDEYLAVVSYTGEVMWVPAVNLHSICDTDISRFPRDNQTCALKFGSWTYDGNLLNITSTNGEDVDVDMESYHENRRWQSTETSGERNIKTYPCCSEPYPDMTYILRLTRNPSIEVLLSI